MICNDKRYIIFLFDVGKGNTGDVGNYGLLEKTKNGRIVQGVPQNISTNCHLLDSPG